MGIYDLRRSRFWRDDCLLKRTFAANYANASRAIFSLAIRENQRNSRLRFCFSRYKR
jgi:hypothetical protein